MLDPHKKLSLDVCVAPCDWLPSTASPSELLAKGKTCRFVAHRGTAVGGGAGFAPTRRRIPLTWPPPPCLVRCCLCRSLISDGKRIDDLEARYRSVEKGVASGRLGAPRVCGWPAKRTRASSTLHLHGRHLQSGGRETEKESTLRPSPEREPKTNEPQLASLEPLPLFLPIDASPVTRRCAHNGEAHASQRAFLG
jgi:hypothetical protein